MNYILDLEEDELYLTLLKIIPCHYEYTEK